MLSTFDFPVERTRIIGNCLLVLGDNRKLLPKISSHSISAIITDPPAGIGFANKNWDTFGSKTQQTSEIACKRLKELI